MKNRGIASEKQLKLPLTRDETSIGDREGDAPVDKEESLMEKVLERENLKRALSQVKRNKGTAGIDGMTIEELTPYLKKHWPEISMEHNKVCTWGMAIKPQSSACICFTL